MKEGRSQRTGWREKVQLWSKVVGWGAFCTEQRSPFVGLMKRRRRRVRGEEGKGLQNK